MVEVYINVYFTLGKQNRGMSVVNAYQHLAGRPLTHIEIDQSFVLGWCIEWLQAFFLVADDIMDNSSMRRGKPCWYKQEHVGSIAINDSFLIESCIYLILKKHFRHHPQYINIVELFHEITFHTEIGQTLDLITSSSAKVRYELFNFARYSAIVKYKTAYYSFYLPIALALYMRGVLSSQAHYEAKTILLKMGEYFQIQDDFLDCFGDSSIIGKVGTDIEEGKCSWLAVKAMEIMTEEQTRSFKANYGLNDVESVRMIKEVYVDLGIPKLFKDYETSSYNELCLMIETRCNSLPKQLFFDFLNKIYGRSR
eukprot:TRINITY_DN3581_c0_g2_i5.p1 TRINITY_DN3581_c0_g2~~TRINITY_DN3581_c0_g2_i5.p1  ORF type:complete len:310 (+),score=14.64 TRINITY_DN3581_c0_g2_i5:105-1034(+)